MLRFSTSFFGFFLCVAVTNTQVQKCKVPSTAPKTIEKVINECQDEIRLAILSEAFQVFNFDEKVKSRSKRDTFSEDETRIAGCLLHCVYRRMNALNEDGFPTAEGLVNLYAQGVKDRGYLTATVQAVAICLNEAEKKIPKLEKSSTEKQIDKQQSLEENGNSCSIAFDVFNCVSDHIGDYCGQTP